LRFEVGWDRPLALDQVWLKCAVCLFLLLALLDDPFEFFVVIHTSLFSLQVERRGHGRLQRVLCLADREQLAGLRVLQVALVCINREFVVQTENLRLAK